ncbi:unnamed protein product [Colias eurytheme]|nr:unnamed protein product [Colias eurytheme]
MCFLFYRGDLQLFPPSPVLHKSAHTKGTVACSRAPAPRARPAPPHPLCSPLVAFPRGSFNSRRDSMQNGQVLRVLYGGYLQGRIFRNNLVVCVVVKNSSLRLKMALEKITRTMDVMVEDPVNK